MFDHFRKLVQDSKGVRQRKIPYFPEQIKRRTGNHHSRERADIIRPDLCKQLPRRACVLNAPGAAANAQQHRYRQLDACLFYAAGRLDRLFGGHALPHPVEQRFISGLHAEVEDAEALLAEAQQFVYALSQDAPRVRIHSDPLEPWEMTPEKREQREQVLLRSHKSVAVSQKDPPRVVESRNTIQDVPFHFRDAANAKLLLLINGAEYALVVGTPDGELEDEAVASLGGRMTVPSYSGIEYFTFFLACCTGDVVVPALDLTVRKSGTHPI